MESLEYLKQEFSGMLPTYLQKCDKSSMVFWKQLTVA
jgi:hypothetical protein